MTSKKLLTLSILITPQRLKLKIIFIIVQLK